MAQITLESHARNTFYHQTRNRSLFCQMVWSIEHKQNNADVVFRHLCWLFSLSLRSLRHNVNKTMGQQGAMLTYLVSSLGILVWWVFKLTNTYIWMYGFSHLASLISLPLSLSWTCKAVYCAWAIIAATTNAALAAVSIQIVLLPMALLLLFWSARLGCWESKQLWRSLNSKVTSHFASSWGWADQLTNQLNNKSESKRANPTIWRLLSSQLLSSLVSYEKLLGLLLNSSLFQANKPAS